MQSAAHSMDCELREWGNAVEVPSKSRSRWPQLFVVVAVRFVFLLLRFGRFAVPSVSSPRLRPPSFHVFIPAGSLGPNLVLHETAETPSKQQQSDLSSRIPTVLLRLPVRHVTDCTASVRSFVMALLSLRSAPPVHSCLDSKAEKRREGRVLPPALALLDAKPPPSAA